MANTYISTIDGHYVKDASATINATASGKTITFTRLEGSTFSVTTLDTVTTVTVSGSGNAVTTGSATNGAVTLTKGNTFVDLTSTQEITGTKSFTKEVKCNEGFRSESGVFKFADYGELIFDSDNKCVKFVFN